MAVVFESLEGLAVSLLCLDIAKLVVSIIIHCIRAVVNSLSQLAKLVVFVGYKGFRVAGDDGFAAVLKKYLHNNVNPREYPSF